MKIKQNKTEASLGYLQLAVTLDDVLGVFKWEIISLSNDILILRATPYLVIKCDLKVSQELLSLFRSLCFI